MEAVVLPRHSLLVRLTHWINAAAFLGLTVSGVAILIAHPRLYWGETGAAGGPALIDLPLPWNLDQSGWGRSLHFLSAWICVVNGAVYVFRGLLSRHFNKHLNAAYSTTQRFAYLGVVFVLLPLMIASGLALSPAITAVFPFVVRMFGGYQSSRTVHFVIASALVIFLIAHVSMVYLAGFRSRVGAMITGRETVKETI
jgi:thiosulfate reductase cytochrome b subunit